MINNKKIFVIIIFMFVLFNLKVLAYAGEGRYSINNNKPVGIKITIPFGNKEEKNPQTNPLNKPQGELEPASLETNTTGLAQENNSLELTGRTKAEVKAMLGEPDRQSRTDKGYIWHYLTEKNNNPAELSIQFNSQGISDSVSYKQ